MPRSPRAARVSAGVSAAATGSRTFAPRRKNRRISLREVVGDGMVDADFPAVMGAEDFAHMLRVKPGCYAFIGNGDGGHRLPDHGPGPCIIHNTSFDFNDEIIPFGASYFVRLAERWLQQE